MTIRPIKTDADYRMALAEINRLMDTAPGTPAGDRLEVLTTLVEHYESLHEPIEPPDPIEALIYHMESRDLERRDLEPCLDSRARVAEVLNRKRALSIEMIRKLHSGLGISAEVLIRPYVVRGSAAWVVSHARFLKPFVEYWFQTDAISAAVTIVSWSHEGNHFKPWKVLQLLQELQILPSKFRSS